AICKDNFLWIFTGFDGERDFACDLLVFRSCRFKLFLVECYLVSTRSKGFRLPQDKREVQSTLGQSLPMDLLKPCDVDPRLLPWRNARQFLGAGEKGSAIAFDLPGKEDVVQ